MARHFLTGEELAPDELGTLLARALELKRTRGDRPTPPDRGPLAGQSVALVFDRPSTRTRVSFEVGIAELGGQPVVLDGADLQLSRGESPRDTALALSRYVHGLGVRTGDHAGVEELATASLVPVVNMLTRSHHPCQALADLLTLRERFGDLEGVRLAYLGDGNNVAHSLAMLGAAAGVDVVLATPPELEPREQILDLARRGAARGGTVTVTHDAASAAERSHALYTDVWVSMGDESEAAWRREVLAPYRLDAALLERARDDAVALHCLPAHPGEEITADVLYGERSAVWDQAENRLHAQKALLELLLA